MTVLHGKGIWLAHSYDLQRAVEMAAATKATHLLIKVGHGPLYFPETARETARRVRGLGFRTLAWLQLTARAPQEALWTIQQALGLGYEAVILSWDALPLTGLQLQPLVEALTVAQLNAESLVLATPPLSALADATALQRLAPLCQGGWMPFCFADWGNGPERVIDRDVYQALGDLSLLWGTTPPVYPVLSPLQSLQGEPLLPEAFIPWVEALSRRGVDFFSIYHAAVTEKALWSLVESVNVPAAEPEETTSEIVPEPGGLLAQPVYVVVAPSDTVWGLIRRYAISKEQFWIWNGHLWDSRGLPRDPDYLQEGWRVRVK